MKKLLILLMFILPVTALAQEDDYKIFDVKQNKTVKLDELVSALKNTDVIFFGEEHNDSVAHWLQVSLFKKMHSQYPKTALTMEMFHTDVQGILNEYLAGHITEKNMTTEARAWKNYKDYKPLIEYAKSNKLDVIAGNAATRYSNFVTRNGLSGLIKLPKSSLTYLPPLPIDTATGKYYENFLEVMGGHMSNTMKVYQTQNLWDATMAWSIAKYLKNHKGTKILQLNGRFHSDYHLGTYAQLLKLIPKVKAVNISSFYADDFEKPDWDKYKERGDYIIVTDPSVKKSY